MVLLYTYFCTLELYKLVSAQSTISTAQSDTMPWNITAHAELPIIETCYSGKLSKTELFAAARETLSVGKERSCTLFLGDCSNLDGAPSIFDLYSLAKEISTSVYSHTLKEALLMPKIPAFIENVNFWETIGRNRGFRVRVFRDRQMALDWLTGDQD